MKRIGRVLLSALAILLMSVFLFSAWKVYSIRHEYSSAERHYDALSEAVVATSAPVAAATPEPPASEAESAAEPQPPQYTEFSPVSVDFEELSRLSGDIVGWLYMPESVINYPVVQGSDNDYYLHRFYDGTPNSGGTLFVDYVCASDFSGRNTIIYGHNMMNGSMFAALNQYKDQAFFDEHPVMYLNTPAQNYKIEFFSGYVSDPEGLIYSSSFSSEEEFASFLDAIRAHSVFSSPVAVTSADRIVTLSTCANTSEDLRFVVCGKLTEIG